MIILGLILLVLGLAGILFLAVKKIPLLAKLPVESGTVVKNPEDGLFKNRFNEIKYSSWRPALLVWVEKNLRKFRLFILKLDNLFVDWIKSYRERSEIWTVRSRAWMEHSRIKRKEKAQVLEKLDKVEVSETMEKIKKEVAADEDKALKEKIINEVKFEKKEEEAVVSGFVQSKIDSVKAPDNFNFAEEEKKCIDSISANPKDIEAYKSLGFLYLRQKNYSDARACFRQVLKFDPSCDEIKNKLNEIRGLRGIKKPVIT